MPSATVFTPRARLFSLTKATPEHGRTPSILVNRGPALLPCARGGPQKETHHTHGR